MATFRLRSFVWDAKSIDPHKGFSFAADFSEAGVGLYLSSPLKPLEHVQVAFESENSPALKAVVAWCNRFSYEQNFIGQSSANFRAGLKFEFSSEMERQNYLSFFQKLKERAGSIQLGMVF